MRVLVMRNGSNPDAIDSSLMLMAYLSSQDIDVTLVDAFDVCALDPKDYSLLVALGGDGTMLRAAHFANQTRLPILGMNFGHLGFLVNKPEDGVIATVAAALSGDVVREERANLRVDVFCEGDDEEEYERLFCEEDPQKGNRIFRGLNEAALSRGASGRLVDFELRISDEHLANMRSDGLVIATATGSTAYALSAGGPLVAPGFGGLIVVPVAPHTLVARAVVTDPHDVIEVNLEDSPASREATLFVDGDLIEFESPIKKIRVCRGQEPTVVLQYRKEGFYRHSSKVFFK